MKKKCSKFLSFMLTLALVIGLLPVMSLTAYASVNQTDVLKAGDTVHSGFPMEWIRIAGTDSRFQCGNATITSIAYNAESQKWVLSIEEAGQTQTAEFSPQTGKNLIGIQYASTDGNPVTSGAYVFNLVWEDAHVSVTGITIDKTAATMSVNDTLTLTATVSPDDATDKTVTWSTSNPDVATVENGVVTAVGKGTTTITATATNGTADTADDFTATCTVTVHAHSFTYSLDGATITATCANSDGLCKLTDNKAALTILAPTTSGGTAVLSGDLKVFGVSSSDIKYAAKSSSG